MRLATFLLTLAAAAGQPLPARVEGRVVSTTGEALPKAVVYLIGYERPLPGVQTDAVGKFVFEDVTPGWYTLSCIRNGFVTQKYRAALNLTPGTELKGFVIHMTQEAAINGRVTDQDGDPVRGADVYVQHPSYPQGRRQLSTAVQVITNDQGYYRAAGLAPGRYYVKAEARHAVTASERKTGSSEADLATYFPSALDETDAKPLDLESGGRNAHGPADDG